MSLSKPNNRIARPAKKYIKFNGAEDDGFFSYWEKFDISDPRFTDEVKGQNVKIDITGMIVLDCDLFTVTGFSKKQGFLWSNEVRTIECEIVARYHGQKNPVARGNWEHVKNELGENAKYTKSIYGWLGGEIVNVHVGGAGLKTWFDVIEGNKERLSKSTIKVASIETGKQGTVTYTYPIFEFGDPIDADDLEKAIEADSNILQPYLDKYFGGDGSGTAEAPKSNDRTEDQGRDTKNWRDYRSEDGVLGLMPMTSILNMISELEDRGAAETEDYDMANGAVLEYREARSTWETKKGKSGYLKDMTFDELKEMYDAIMDKAPKHPSRLFVEAAMQAKMAEVAETADEEDDIPF